MVRHASAATHSLLWKIAERVVLLWEQLQVELHGQYSVERLYHVHTYSKKTSVAYVLVVLLLTPVPCLTLISVLDLLPLEPLSTGYNESYVFRIRAGIGTFCMAFCALEQYRQLIPNLKTSLRQVLLMSIFTTAGTTVGAMYVARLFGFPIPFFVIAVAPVYLVFLTIAIAVAWGKQLKNDLVVRQELMNYQIIVSLLFVLTFVYPAYNHVFRTLSSSSQTWFALLLPIIKLAAKNAISPFCAFIEDYKPEALIFNVEIFHALFVAVCMQSSTSMKTTLLLMAMDFVHAVLSLRDVDVVVKRINKLRDKVLHASLANTPGAAPLASAVDHVLFLVKTDKAVYSNDQIRVQSRSIAKVVTKVEPTGPTMVRPATTVNPSSSQLAPPTVTQSGLMRRASIGFNLDVIPETVALHEQHLLMKTLNPDEREEYVENMLKLLHMVEFMLLVEFTEVIIPIVYSLYLIVAIHSPNQTFYPHLEHLSIATLAGTVGNILVYSILELVSFVVLHVVLQRKLQLSPVRQLGYVLHKQGKLVQLKICVWLLFMVQISLKQFGMDFSFSFNWLDEGK